MTGDMAYAKGRASATAMEALTPGMAPKITPTTVPKKIKTKVEGFRTILSPFNNNSNMLFPPYQNGRRPSTNSAKLRRKP